MHGAGERKSLAIPAGASATTPAVCVTLLHPTLRFFARNKGSLLGVLRVDVIAETPLGLRLTLPVGVVVAGSSWTPTLPNPFLANALALLGKDGEMSVAFRFTSMLGGSSRSTTSTSIRIAAPDAGPRSSRPRKGSPRARATLARMATRSKPLNIGRLGEIAQVAVRHGFGYLIEGRRGGPPDPDGADGRAAGTCARCSTSSGRRSSSSASSSRRGPTSSRPTSSPSSAGSRTTCARSRTTTSSA